MKRISLDEKDRNDVVESSKSLIPIQEPLSPEDAYKFMEER